jgi:dipeptidyl aminopeptidase/acylaminoacyl peptidase
MEERQFGLWESPLSPRELAGMARFRDLAWDSDGRTLVWLEDRGQGGMLVCQQGREAPRTLNPTQPSRAQVGYGGGEFAVSRKCLYFVGTEGRLWRQGLEGGGARALTPSFGHAAAPCPSPDGGWIVYIHTAEDRDCIAVVDAEGSVWPTRLVRGADFYMQPAWHPRGKMLAWIEWDHPQMPWDGSRLVLGELRFPKGTTPVLSAANILVGDATTSLFQPLFSPDGNHLVYVSDTRGWSNIWLYNLSDQRHSCLTEDERDVGLPAWIQGMRAISFSADGKRIYFTRSESGCRRAYVCELETTEISEVAEIGGYTSVEQLTAAPRGRSLACIASSGTIPPRVVRTEATSVSISSRSSSETIPSEELAQPQSLTWKAADGCEINGLYYAPASTRFSGRGAPPAIVSVHGGPTSQAECGFDARNQFFATRGYAVLDINYRGSTGFGRAYAQLLRGNWGVFDVEDAFGGGQHLVDSGLANESQLIIMGGSAGGYTTLRALTERPGFFRAGICSYGICNLFSLAAETHKFEAHYTDSLIGPLPESSGLYRERSPIFSIEKIADPLIVFQGAEDRVVPKEQAEELVASLARRNVPHEYHLFDGEGHGWKKPETIESYYLTMESFLRRHVIFN